MKTLPYIILVLFISKTVFAEINKTSAEKSTPSSAVINSTGKSSIFLLCKDNTQSVRTLRMEKKASGQCVTSYSKQGIDKPQIHSKKEEDCLEVMQNIRANLEKGNWKCKEISGLRISGSQ